MKEATVYTNGALDVVRQTLMTFVALMTIIHTSFIIVLGAVSYISVCMCITNARRDERPVKKIN